MGRALLSILIAGLMVAAAHAAGAPEKSGGLIISITRLPSPEAGTLRERRVLRLSATSHPPKLDGNLDEDCWRQAPVTGDLLMKAGSERSTPFPKKTTLRATFDDSNLYLAFECFDPKIDTLLAKYTKRDDRYWLEDDIEFMIDTNYDRKGFYQFLFNAAGGKGDYVCRVEDRRITAEAAFDPVWWLKTKVDEDRWVGEIALPFRSLGIDGVEPGARWGFNFCRIENPGSLLGNWTRATNHRDTRLFGDLVFGKAPFALGETDLGPRAHGVNLMRATVKNNTAEPRTLEVTTLLSVGGRPVGRASAGRKVSPSEDVPLFVPYDLPLDAERVHMDLRLVDTQWGRVVVQRAYELTPPPVLETRLASVEYFEKDKEARLHFKVEVGDLTAATGRLRLTLYREGGENPLLADTRSPIPSGEGMLRADISSLGSGAYVLELSVLDATGQVFATKRMPFSKAKSLLDF